MLIVEGSKYTKYFEFMDEQQARLCEIDHIQRGWLVRRDLTSVKCFKDYNSFNQYWPWSIKNEYYKKYGRIYY